MAYSDGNTRNQTVLFRRDLIEMHSKRSQTSVGEKTFFCKYTRWPKLANFLVQDIHIHNLEGDWDMSQEVKKGYFLSVLTLGEAGVTELTCDCKYGLT